MCLFRGTIWSTKVHCNFFALAIHYLLSYAPVQALSTLSRRTRGVDFTFNALSEKYNDVFSFVNTMTFGAEV